MNVRLEEPAWLWLLAAIPPSAVVALAAFSSMSPLRRASAILFRSALIALIALALAGVGTARRTDRLAVIAVVDASGSVRRYAGGDPLERVREFLRVAETSRGPDDLLGMVVFEARAAAAATPTRGAVSDRTVDARLGEGTNIADAITLAQALVPPDASARLVLFSDGVPTAGDALDAAARLATPGRAGPRSIPLDVVPLEYRIEREVVVESLDAPARAPSESVVSLRAAIRSAGSATGVLRVLDDLTPVPIGAQGEEGNARRVLLRPGTTVEVLPVRLDSRRTHRWRVVFEPDPPAPGEPPPDTLAENNAAEAFTLAPGRRSVLIIDGTDPREDAGRTLERPLRDAGIQTTLVSPAGAPPDLLALQGYDLVVLLNVAADALPAATHAQLAAYVRGLGGGLVMVGGPDSFGAGGWKGTALEPLLPVRLDLPEQAVTPEVAIVLVLDNSGSMGRPVFGSFKNQQAIANESAALAVRLLDRRDVVGVITFNNEHDVLVPPAPNTRPQDTVDRILSIRPGGGTDAGPAMIEAGRLLDPLQAKLKHVIVLSDGRSQNATSLPGIAADLQGRGITVSTIAVGDAADLRTMELMAQRGGGTFYNVVDPNILPRVFSRAVRVVRTPMIREEPFEPVVLTVASPLTAGLGVPPPLGGLSLTRVREDPGVVTAIITPQGEPVLAHWVVEVGQVAAFTSDAHRWAADWLDWPGYARFWTQTARIIGRAPSGQGTLARIELADGRARVRLDAAAEDGTPMDFLDARADLYPPEGEPIEVPLAQVGPGVYEGTVPASRSGTYVAVVSSRRGDQRLEPAIAGAALAAGEEYRRLSSDSEYLSRLAAATGGRMLRLDDPVGADLFDRSGVPRREAVTPLTRVLLPWIVAVLLLDIATRRVAWDRRGPRDRGQPAGAPGARAALRALAAGSRRREESDRPLEPVLALSDRDADLLARAAADRRLAERLRAARDAAAMREPAPDAAPPPAPAPRAPEAPGVPPAGAGPAAGDLRAAKARARERFGVDHDRPDDAKA